MAAQVKQYETGNLAGIPKLVIIWYRSTHKGKCFYCGCTLTDENRTKDHVVPRAAQVNSKPCKNNCVPCCATCNVSKGHLQARQFREKIVGMITDRLFYGERMYIHSLVYRKNRRSVRD